MKNQISVEKIYRIDLNSGQTEANNNALQKELRYDKNGNLIKEINYNPPGVVDQIVAYKYDQNNRLIDESCFDDEEELLEKTIFEWGPNGHKTKAVKHYQDGSFDTTTYKFDANNKLIEKECVDDENEAESKDVFTYQGDLLTEHINYDEDGDIAERTSFIFEQGKKIEERHWESSDQAENLKKFQYDEDGNLLKELYYNPSGQLIKKTEYISYQDGLMTEFVDEDPYGKVTTKLQYDENRNIIFQEQTNGKGELNHRIERVFDEHQRVLETNTFVNVHGRGVNLSFREIHQYELFDELKTN